MGGENRPSNQDSPRKIVTPGTPRLKVGSTMTLTKQRAFENVLSPSKTSKKSLFLEDLSKDSILSIDSVPSKPARRRSQQGSTHNALFSARCIISTSNEGSSHAGQEVKTPVIVKPQYDRPCKNIFFAKDASKVRKPLEKVEALLLDPSMHLDFSGSEGTAKIHVSLPSARWLSSVPDSTSTMGCKRVSSDVNMPSMPRRTISTDSLMNELNH